VRAILTLTHAMNVLSVNDVRLKTTGELLMATADTFFDIKESIPESHYVTSMNALCELEKRFKQVDKDLRLMWYTNNHPVNIDDIDVEAGEEVSSISVVQSGDMTQAQARERLVLDLISISRWRMWSEVTLRNMKPIYRFTNKVRMRAYKMICSQENIDISSVTTYESLRCQSARLTDVDEKTFISNFKTAYNIAVERKKHNLKELIHNFSMKEEALKLLLAM
jgi:hypothetical protein